MKDISNLKSKISREWIPVLGLALYSRIFFFAAITFASTLFLGKERQAILTLKFWADMLSKWDGQWYLGIVTNGYDIAPRASGEANYAFYPLYPLLIKSLNFITGLDIRLSGVLISTICFFISIIFFYKLLRLDFVAKRSLTIIKYFLVFPGAIYASLIYTESLFFLLTILIFYYARKNNWFLVGIFGLLITLTRSVGVLFLLPVLYEYALSKNFNIKNIRFDILYLSSFGLGFLLWCYYNFRITGNFFAFMDVQEAWGRKLGNHPDLISFAITYRHITFIYDYIVAFLFLLLLIYMIKKVRVSYLMLSFISFFVPIATGIFSIPRFISVIFPVFIGLAYLTAKRPNLRWILFTTFAALQMVIIITWVTGHDIAT